FGGMLAPGGTLIDIKSVIDRDELAQLDLNVWRV
ncbi:MAG: hypothetical protein ACI9NT_002791, partial [Bacteroidia bacterium]